MAILRPVSAFPNKNTIDATKTNKFSTIIQGASTVVSAYSMFIFGIDSITTSGGYTLEKKTLTKPLTAGNTLEISVPPTSGMQNGNSYFWSVRLYQSTPSIFITNSVVQADSTETNIVIRKHNNVKAGMVLQIGQDKRDILTYDKTTGVAVIATPFSYIPMKDLKCEIYSDFVDSINFPFNAKLTPTLTITTLSPTGHSRVGNFQAIYTQPNNSNILWYQFQLFDAENIIIKDTGKIPSASLFFSYDKFLNDTIYYVKATVEDSNGIVTESAAYTNSVSYDVLDLDNPSHAEEICGECMVKVWWSEDRLSLGVATGEYVYVFEGNNYAPGGTDPVDPGSPEIPPTPIPFMNYFWYDQDTDGVDIIWDDAKYWLETDEDPNVDPGDPDTPIDTDIPIEPVTPITPALEDNGKRVTIMSGEVYYDRVGGEELAIKEDDFTIFSDIRVTPATVGKIISLSNGTSEYFLSIEGEQFSYTKNGVKTLIGKVLDSAAGGQTVDGIALEGTSYRWNDSDVWNDNYYWTESPGFAYSYKITILPDEIRMLKLLEENIDV